MRAAFLFPILAVLWLGPSPWCSRAHGQWGLGLEVGADRFWGGSLDTSGEHRSFRPYRPTTFGVGVERRRGRLGFGLHLRYTEAGLGLEGEGAVAAVDGVFTMVSISPEVAYRVASLGPATQLRLHAGPLFEVWSIIDEESRTRAGLQGSASLDVPLGGRFAGSVLAGLALVPSPFVRGDLDPSYELRALWRRRFAVALQYRL